MLAQVRHMARKSQVLQQRLAELRSAAAAAPPPASAAPTAAGAPGSEEQQQHGAPTLEQALLGLAQAHECLARALAEPPLEVGAAGPAGGEAPARPLAAPSLEPAPLAPAAAAVSGPPASGPAGRPRGGSSAGGGSGWGAAEAAAGPLARYRGQPSRLRPAAGPPVDPCAGFATEGELVAALGPGALADLGRSTKAVRTSGMATPHGPAPQAPAAPEVEMAGAPPPSHA